MTRASDFRIPVVDDSEPGLQLSLQNLDLTLRVSHQLQLIDVHSIRQLANYPEDFEGCNALHIGLTAFCPSNTAIDTAFAQ